eukprot:m.163164 g.163164  ORF g.163164 m.163164 type:complete len:224 (+) comp53072_c0_seq9:627-1298(+)
MMRLSLINRVKKCLKACVFGIAATFTRWSKERLVFCTQSHTIRMHSKILRSNLEGYELKGNFLFYERKTWTLRVMNSRHIGHSLTLTAHCIQDTMWPHSRKTQSACSWQQILHKASSGNAAFLQWLCHRRCALRTKSIFSMQSLWSMKLASRSLRRSPTLIDLNSSSCSICSNLAISFSLFCSASRCFVSPCILRHQQNVLVTCEPGAQLNEVPVKLIASPQH